MKKVVVACSGAEHIAKKIASQLKSEYTVLQVSPFPDGEMDLRFLKDLKRKHVILVQSFYDNLNDKVVETLFAGYTSKDLGAKKVDLFALHFPYLRKDKRFKSGECISSQVMSKLFSVFDRNYVIDPHLHRIKVMKKLVNKGVRLDAVPLIAEYVKKMKLKDLVFVGPDSESLQWARRAANSIDEKYTILEKTRYGSRNVKVKFTEKVDFLKGKNVVIIDDIISSGHTMLETIKKVKAFKPKKIYCIAIHGIFADEATAKKLAKESVLISTNTIPTKYSKIDVSSLAKEIK